MSKITYALLTAALGAPLVASAQAPASAAGTHPSRDSRPTSTRPTEYVVDGDHTHAGFRVRHMMVSWTQGRFSSVQGNVRWNDAAPEQSSIHVTLDAASIDTNHKKRDEHLRSQDFFFVEKHPQITFKSKRTSRTGQDRYDVVGDLTIRGVTREVVLAVVDSGKEVRDPWGGVRRGATATTTVHRKDFGLNWNAALELGGVAVGDDVHVSIELELIRKS